MLQSCVGCDLIAILPGALPHILVILSNNTINSVTNTKARLFSLVYICTFFAIFICDLIFISD